MCSPFSRPFFFSWSGAHRSLHSFPTRRFPISYAHAFDPLDRYFAPVAAAPSPVTIHPDPPDAPDAGDADSEGRSEEHTSELQSHSDLVCRLLLEKKKPYGSRAVRDRLRSFNFC